MKYDTYCFEGRDIKSLLTPLCTHLQTLTLVFNKVTRLLTLLSSISCEKHVFISRVTLRTIVDGAKVFKLPKLSLNVVHNDLKNLQKNYDSKVGQFMDFICFDFISAKLSTKMS